ncbi:MAG TPA: ABC transporter ATP-binding protein [Bacilli bacterium]|nr:ABC transporter ATP-binding protein [Bacilli bacterium]
MFKIFRDLSWFIKKHWFKYLFIVILTVVFIYAITLPAQMLGDVIDVIDRKTIDMDYVTYIFIAMAVIGFVIYLSGALKRYLTGSLTHKLFYNLRYNFLTALFKQDADFFEEIYAGDLISRATGDVGTVSRISTHMVFALFDTIVMLVISSSRMIGLNLKLALLAVIPLPIIFLIVVILRPKISQNWRAVRTQVGRLNNQVMESVSGAKLVRGFVKEKEDEQKLSESATLAYKIERKSVLLNSVFMPTFRIVTLISMGIAIAYGSHLIIHQQDFTVGNLISFNIYLGMFSSPLFQLGNQITFIAQSGVSFDRINEVLNARPTIKDKDFAKDLVNIDKIEYRDLSFKYPKDQNYSLENIDLNLEKGKTLGIVGKTGSGKSTLVRQLLRQFPITSGNILINNRSINSYKKESIRLNIAYVPQEHTLFSRTVLDNVKLGISPATVYSIDEVVKMADFEKDLQFLHDGLATMVGEAGVTLSGGQKQRLSIARALLRNSDLLIFDDSLSAVDGMTEANILRNIKEIRSDQMKIIVAHRLTAVERADEIIVLDMGKIVERGTHQQLMENKKWYYEQYLIQEMEDDNAK